MFPTNKQKFNASTAKAFQIANLVTEYVLDSKNYFFVKLEITITKMNGFDARNVAAVMKFCYGDKYFDLKVEFSLSKRPTFDIQEEKVCEWELFSDWIELTAQNHPSPVSLESRIGRNTARFTVYGPGNESKLEEFKNSFRH